MKARNILIAAAFAALTLLGAGCKKYNFSGSDIRFVASAKAVQTKTAYDGVITGDADNRHERINWVVGDKIAIAMTNGEGSECGDYLVNGVTAYSDEVSRATLSPLGGEFGGNGLQWGTGAHAFFALYPSPSIDDSWGNELGSDHLVLSYPATPTLTPKGVSDADALTLVPDMKYAYMCARTAVAGPTSTIDLSFTPLFTAFEISIGAGDNNAVNLTEFKLISHAEGEYLAGVKNFDDGPDTDPSYDITVDLTGIRLVRNGNPLVLTVFAYAEDSFSQLTLQFTGAEIGTRTLDLKKNGEWIEFAGMAKHRLIGLYFPALDEGSAGGQEINWDGTVGEDLNWNGAEGEEINWGGNRPYVLPGEFSVSATKKVNFSRGNLVYKAGEWDFHRQQYDKCFSANAPLSFFGPDVTFDLFGWATAGIAAVDNTMVYYQPWMFNYSPIESQSDKNPYGHGPSIDNVPGGSSWDAYAEYCDWGNNYTLAQALGTGWYTLSAAEWAYLFTLRSASEVNGVANARFAKAMVCGVHGLLIFSDDFGTRFTGDPSIFDANSINQMDKDASDFSDIVLSRTDWAVAEAAGAVFLPAAGLVFMFGLTANTDSSIIVYYWSSTAATSVNSAMLVGAGSSFMPMGTENVLYLTGNAAIRGTGCAVRLVKNAE